MRGIYKIRNKDNGKYYVGSSIDIDGRWREHKKGLINNLHYNKKLQSSWNIHGESAFEFFVVEELPDYNYKQLLSEEQKYLDVAKKEKPSVYNLKFTAVGGWNWGDDRLRLSVKRGKDHRDYDPTVYTFIHQITKEEFVGSRWEFYTTKGLMRHHVRGLVQKRRHVVKGWKLREKGTA